MNNNEDDWEYSINLPHSPLAVGVVRGALRLMLRAHGLGELLVTAELLASELITNAHVHAPGPVLPACEALREMAATLGVGHQR
ncbi:hypothetical protein AB0D14_15100 [Streptomyces sp. NPDC048484]|uniref:hypothetical protein n=1 Tax=Streptomyces sp. NPDC048484 TaxID=3155146 RepID=UPI0034347F09